LGGAEAAVTAVTGDGHVDEDEFKAGLRKIGLDVDDEAMHGLFVLFDTDGSGTIEIQVRLAAIYLGPRHVEAHARCQELNTAVRLLKKPEGRYGPHTIAKDGSSFNKLIPEMHGAKMDFLLSLEDPSARSTGESPPCLSLAC
jgi:hypothetical protein